ncbi:hypothetical protein ABZX30_36110, partial [Streptomyces sp. NPDC004542]
TIVIHTMTPSDWESAHERSSEQFLAAEAVQLGVTFKMKAKIKRQVRIASMRMLWPAMLGQAVAFEPGHPELVIVPEALQHAGQLNNDPVLHKLLGHEMTHLAQYAASEGAMWAAQDSYFPDHRGIADREYQWLLEGHAYWADRRITSKIFGEPVSTDEPSPDASARYLTLYTSPLRAPIVEMQRRATDSVTQIIDTYGLEGFNRVWTTPDLVPLKAETSAPEIWQKRFG